MDRIEKHDFSPQLCMTVNIKIMLWPTKSYVNLQKCLNKAILADLIVSIYCYRYQEVLSVMALI